MSVNAMFLSKKLSKVYRSVFVTDNEVLEYLIIKKLNK